MCLNRLFVYLDVYLLFGLSDCLLLLLFVCLYTPGEEEDVVSQKQRQQWFQQVEEKSKSGEWDDGSPPPPHLSIYPTAIPGTHYSIPGLHPDWQVATTDRHSE